MLVSQNHNIVLSTRCLCFLQRNQPIKIDNIIRAGSLGHGTAVPGDFDLDLVIYSRGEQELLSTKKLSNHKQHIRLKSYCKPPY